MNDISTLSNSQDNYLKQRRRRSISIDKLRTSACSLELKHSPHDIEEAGTALCCCNESTAYPLCDGRTHHEVNRKNNTTIQPITMEYCNSAHLSKPELRRSCQPAVCNTQKPQEEELNILQNKGKQHLEQNQSIEINQKQAENSNKMESSKKKEHVIRKVDRRKITAEFTVEEVEKHNTKDDCWMIIKGNVYDITPYFDYHPGGERALLKFAGKDGTENVQFHSSKMMEILNTYLYIGKLKKDEQPSSCTIS